jgi:hypothetical protein
MCLRLSFEAMSFLLRQHQSCQIAVCGTSCNRIPVAAGASPLPPRRCLPRKAMLAEFWSVSSVLLRA